jgi:CheY-like chemotaxis protein
VQNRVILAVEPDPRQAAQLTALFRRQFSQELVLAGTTPAALDKLQGRIPELVLTSALITPRDETALIHWLRELGRKAAHVQTVTIPVLASESEPPAEKKKPGGLTFVWEKPSVASAPDSCDPAVFADWISVYLDLASTHREELQYP